MPAPQPYAAHKKAELIAHLSTLPDGLQDFLETPLPAAPSITTPADVDAAIIASGVLSKYLLDAFRPYAGLFLAALPAHVGQLNDWHNAGILSGLQAWSGAIDEGPEGGGGPNRLSVQSPQPGAVYAPGDLRCQCKGDGGTLATVIVSVGGEDIKLQEESGTFWGLFHLPEAGSFTATFAGTFTEGDPESKEIAFTIQEGADTPAEGGGLDDLIALDVAKKVFDLAVRNLLEGATRGVKAEIERRLKEVQSAAQKVFTIGQKVASKIPAKVQKALEDILDFWTNW